MHNTVAAGMIQDDFTPVIASDKVTSAEREQRLRQKGHLIVAQTEHLYQIERILFQAGYLPVVVENDDETLCAKLIDVGLLVICDQKHNRANIGLTVSSPSTVLETLKRNNII